MIKRWLWAIRHEAWKWHTVNDPRNSIGLDKPPRIDETRHKVAAFIWLWSFAVAPIFPKWLYQLIYRRRLVLSLAHVYERRDRKALREAQRLAQDERNTAQAIKAQSEWLVSQHNQQQQVINSYAARVRLLESMLRDMQTDGLVDSEWSDRINEVLTAKPGSKHWGKGPY